MVELASRHDTTGDRVLILVVLRVEELLGFFSGCIESEPASIFRVGNSLCRDTVFNKPFSNLSLGLLRGAKRLNYLL
jgi:hypothetical protein